MAVFAGGGASHLHGVTGSAHPVGNILAEIWYLARPDLFSVALLAIAFQIILVCPVRKGDPVLELEGLCAIISINS